MFFNSYFKISFETSNGISQQQSGKLKNAGTDTDAIEVNGSYSYTDGSGKKVSVTFVANENGYLPQVSILGCKEKKTFIGSFYSFVCFHILDGDKLIQPHELRHAT